MMGVRRGLVIWPRMLVICGGELWFVWNVVDFGPGSSLCFGCRLSGNCQFLSLQYCMGCALVEVSFSFALDI